MMNQSFDTPEQEREYWRQRRHLYQFPKFTINGIEFVMAVPKDRYDPFKIMELLDKYHGGKE